MPICGLFYHVGRLHAPSFFPVFSSGTFEKNLASGPVVGVTSLPSVHLVKNVLPTAGTAGITSAAGICVHISVELKPVTELPNFFP
jgi:hypothetical protein